MEKKAHISREKSNSAICRCRWKTRLAKNDGEVYDFIEKKAKM
jgi:hypothetical protein